MNIIDPPGNDSLVGTTGHDTFIFYDNWGQDTISAPAGNNILDFSHTTRDLLVDNNDLGPSATDIVGGQSLNSVVWSHSNQFQEVIGGAGNDQLLFFRIEVAGAGNDTLNATFGNDTLIAGSGNDQLLGGFDGSFKSDGNDTYIFNNKFGNDTIVDSGGNNTIDLSRVSSNLNISFNTDKTITVPVGMGGETTVTIKQVTFTDGTHTISGQTTFISGNSDQSILQNLIGGSGNNTIVDGGSAPDTIWCKNGNDTVTGSNAGDIFVGGSGNNLLKGGTGDDSYLFYNGFGHDTIQDAGGWDQVKFMPGIQTNNVAIAYDDQGDLLIGVVGSPNSEIIVKNRTSTGWLEHLQTGDGSFLSGSNINTLLQEMSAYAASHGQSIHNLQDVENNPNLMAMVNNAWHH